MASHPKPHYEYLLVYYNSPPDRPVTIGVLLWSPTERRLRYRFSTSWIESIADEDEREIALLLIDDLADKVSSSNGEEFLLYCEDTLSNILTISDRGRQPGNESPQVLLERLYREHVEA
jgi:hypothetical protein